MKIELMNLMLKQTQNVDIIKKMISAYDNLPERYVKKILITLKECKYNENALNIARNPDVLRNRTLKKQIKLMNALKEHKYNENALEIAINLDVLSKRTTEEQIKLMNVLKACKYDEDVLAIAIDKNVLRKRTVEEQIQLMKPSNIELEQYETLSKTLDKIKTVEELSEYVNRLQKEYGSEADIKAKDKVKTYK